MYNLHTKCYLSEPLVMSYDIILQVLQNVDELFDREELSAAPDAGWPDCFNSGVFVFRPSEETYDSLLKFAMSQGSFDGMTYVRLDVLLFKQRKEKSSKKKSKFPPPPSHPPISQKQSFMNEIFMGLIKITTWK